MENIEHRNTRITFDIPMGCSNEEAINYIIKNEDLDTNLISDGYHTFGELYEHRIVNFIALCRILDKTNRTYQLHGLTNVWKSKRHSDGELAFGGEWFVLGINRIKGEQITYHLPISKWADCDFAMEEDTAPEWDGHTSEDVLERLSRL